MFRPFLLNANRRNENKTFVSLSSCELFACHIPHRINELQMQSRLLIRLICLQKIQFCTTIRLFQILIMHETSKISLQHLPRATRHNDVFGVLQAQPLGLQQEGTHSLHYKAAGTSGRAGNFCDPAGEQQRPRLQQNVKDCDGIRVRVTGPNRQSEWYCFSVLCVNWCLN